MPKPDPTAVNLAPRPQRFIPWQGAFGVKIALMASKSLSSLIHPTAIINKGAVLGRNVRVGPFSVIEDKVSIGDNTTIFNNVYIGEGTTVGKSNFISTGSVIGGEAQRRSGVDGSLNIGDNNIFKEYVTIHKGSEKASSTRIGNHNYFMACAHVGHDSNVQDHVTLTNAVLIGGHVLLENNCFLEGGSGVHQFCRVGSYAMIGGGATVTKDVPPYMLLGDNECLVGSMNLTGLREGGFSEEDKRDIRQAYKLLYLSHLNVTQALAAIVKVCSSDKVLHLIDFIKKSKRGILFHRRQKSSD